MEVDMLHEAGQALLIIADPTRLFFLASGVMIGLMLGVIPGLGGIVGMALLLPFTFDMDPYTAFAFLLGMGSVTTTSDTIPAVLFGVPGTAGSAATILDGHPLARQGQAGRAFGAAYSASLIGGVFGALLLAVSIPILRPVMLYLGSPELLAFSVFGLSMVAVLSGRAPLRGLGAAGFGLLVAMIGSDPQTGTLRWTLASLYLWDGLPLVPVTIGLFALPELADMAISRRSIATGDEAKVDVRKGQWQGVRDTFTHWWLVLRCSLLGSSLGAIPGIGAAIIDWIAYGHAARTEKGASETFGKGDIRGVIASESSNNAKEGGALVPTIAFGVPGSASMTLILGAFLIHGIVPGPKMLGENLDITYTMVWSIAIANVLGAGVCFLFANQLAKIAKVRVGILAPLVLAVVFVGAFQGSRQWGDLYALLLFGTLGWIMKRLRWPRPPLILGFVLGGLIENYMFISVTRYGADWLSRPWVMVIFAMTLYGILAPIVRGYRARARAPSGGRVIGFQRQNLNPDMAFCLAVIGLFGACIYLSSEWEFAAQLVPQVVGWAGVIFTGMLLISGLFVAPGEKPAMAGANPTGPGEGQEASAQSDMHFDIQVDFGDLSKRTIFIRAATYFAWCLFFLGAAAVVGILPALLLFLIGYIRFEGKESWKMTLAVALPVWGFSYFLFHTILRILWPHALIGDWFPALRSIQVLNLF